MYKIRKVRTGYKGYTYVTHKYSTGLDRLRNTTGKWVCRVSAVEYEFVRNWLHSLLHDV